MGVDPGGCILLEKMWTITYAIYPPSSRPTTGSLGGACNDTERCNRAARFGFFYKKTRYINSLLLYAVLPVRKTSFNHSVIRKTCCW